MMEEDEEPDRVEITIPGHEIDITQAPKSVLQMFHLAEKWGFVAKIGMSQFHVLPKVYGPKAKNPGDEYGEKTVDNYWLEAVNPDRKVRIQFTWHDGKAIDGLWGSRLVKSTMLKSLIMGEVDKVFHVSYVEKTRREKDYE